MADRPRLVWGKRPNTVRATRFRRSGLPDHMPPGLSGRDGASGRGTAQRNLDRHGDRWPGTSRVLDPAARRRRNRETWAKHRRGALVPIAEQLAARAAKRGQR